MTATPAKFSRTLLLCTITLGALVACSNSKPAPKPDAQPQPAYSDIVQSGVMTYEGGAVEIYSVGATHQGSPLDVFGDAVNNSVNNSVNNYPPVQYNYAAPPPATPVANVQTGTPLVSTLEGVGLEAREVEEGRMDLDEYE